MSHFTRLRTKMTTRRTIERALTDLKYEYETGDVSIRGYMGQRTRAEIKVFTGHRGYDIGFSRSNGHFDVVADWWGIRKVKRQKFLDDVTQRYAYHATREKLEEQGFELVEEVTEKSGEVRLLLRRAV